VRSILEYAAVVWDPYHQGDIQKLERIQHRAARFITGDYKSKTPGCVTAMLDNLNLPSLQDRRRDKRLSYLHRILDGSVQALPPDKFIKHQRQGKRLIQPKQFEDYTATNLVIRSARKNSQPLEVPIASTEQLKNSFFIKTAVDWNNLSQHQLQGLQQQTRETSGSNIV
jgi:hypothetical protein